MLEAFPATSEQLHSLRRVAVRRGVPVMVLELSTSDEVLVGRALASRFWPACDGSAHRDGQYPASPAMDNLHRCAPCRQFLALRHCDHPQTFTQRLRTYRELRAEVRRAADCFDVAWCDLDASGALADVVDKAVQAVETLLPSSPTSVPV